MWPETGLGCLSKERFEGFQQRRRLSFGPPFSSSPAALCSPSFLEPSCSLQIGNILFFSSRAQGSAGPSVKS